MTRENETVSDIVKRVRRDCNSYPLPTAAAEMLKLVREMDAAHQREVAELKHWIKSAARWIKCHDIYHTSGGDLIKQAKEILNDDGEFLFKKGEQ